MGVYRPPEGMRGAVRPPSPPNIFLKILGMGSGTIEKSRQRPKSRRLSGGTIRLLYGDALYDAPRGSGGPRSPGREFDAPSNGHVARRRSGNFGHLKGPKDWRRVGGGAGAKIGFAGRNSGEIAIAVKIRRGGWGAVGYGSIANYEESCPYYPLPPLIPLHIWIVLFQP